MLNIGFLFHFSFPKTLFPSFLHHFYLQFLYPTNFLVRECFSLLVSSIFNFIVDDICEYWQVLASYSYDVASLIENGPGHLYSPPPPPPPPPPPHFNYQYRIGFCSGSALYRSGRTLTRRPSRFWRYSSRHLARLFCC